MPRLSLRRTVKALALQGSSEAGKVTFSPKKKEKKKEPSTRGKRTNTGTATHCRSEAMTSSRTSKATSLQVRF